MAFSIEQCKKDQWLCERRHTVDNRWVRCKVRWISTDNRFYLTYDENEDEPTQRCGREVRLSDLRNITNPPITPTQVTFGWDEDGDRITRFAGWTDKQPQREFQYATSVHIHTTKSGQRVVLDAEWVGYVAKLGAQIWRRHDGGYMIYGPCDDPIRVSNVGQHGYAGVLIELAKYAERKGWM